MQDAKKFWDKAAEKYAKSPIGDMAAYEYTLGRTKSYLKPTDHILEVGCGTGSTALLLSSHVSQVTASDLSDAMIEIGRKKAEAQGITNVRFVAAELVGDEELNGTYDVVLALNVLHLVEDSQAAINRLADLVKPGGYFISKTVCKPGKDAPFKFKLLLPLIPIMQWFGKAPFVRFLTPNQLESQITEAGFKIIETGNHPAPSRYIVAERV